MDALPLIIVMAIVLGLLIHAVLPAQQPPQVIYIHTEAPQDTGLGCLPLILLGVLVLVVLHLS